MKKLATLMMTGILALGLLGGCGNDNGGPADNNGGAPAEGSLGSIVVVSREDGSGTRGAFIELTGVEEKDANGNKMDNTTVAATIASKTDIMMTQVQGNDAAIGYVSAGSLNDNIKALKVDGAAPTPENIQSGAYKLARPFKIATKGQPEGLAKDFIDFIMSKEGQAVVAVGYIPVEADAPAYAGSKPSGKIVIAGSSSVTPIMEKLQEAYIAINPNATIEVQQSDSTAGMQGAIDGICDIGMASRDLKDSEKESLTDLSIAIDGIAVIVNNNNPLEDISTDMIKQIYTGAVTDWAAVQ